MIQSKDNEIVGLIPAGGKATRLGPLPCSKEVFPLGYREMADGTKRPKVLSNYLLDKYKIAGASKTFFVLGQEKFDIPTYYGDGKMIGMDLAYLMMDLPYGAPYTLDQAYPFIGGKTVLLGFPDILFQPEDCFVQLLDKMKADEADVVLGLYQVDDPETIRRSDMVGWNASTGEIHKIFIKPQEGEFTHSWIMACWGPAFTEFMHAFLQEDLKQREADSENFPEIYQGHIVQAAIEKGLKVSAVLFEGYGFQDIGTPTSLEAVTSKPELYEQLTSS